MSIAERVQSIVERLQTSAGVKTVYGEPVKAEGKTIIPVARVAYAFGMCSCGNIGKQSETPDQQGPGGGAGALSIRPAGVLEVTQAETRFIPTGMGRKLAGAVLVGLLLGILIAGKRSKRD